MKCATCQCNLKEDKTDNKVKVDILTNGEMDVLKMLERFDVKKMQIFKSGLCGCDAPHTQISIFISPNSIETLISELKVINETNYFTGISNYPDIRKYL